MKKYIFFSVLFILSFKSGYTQCTPLSPTGNAGFTPPSIFFFDGNPDLFFPKIERGVFFTLTLYFENFNHIGGATVEWLKFDSIINLPEGINYTLPADTLLTGETACIDFFGVTNDETGLYFLGFYITARLNILPNPISSTINDLSAQFNGPPCNYSFWVVDINAGINNKQLLHSFAYPNPTNGKFIIEMNGSESAKGEAEIYNVMGEKVYETTISEPTSTISLDVLDGIYFIHIITKHGTASRKIVVSQ